jgi:glutathione S-transferase
MRLTLARAILSRMNDIVLCEIGETGVDGLESWSPYCLKVHRALRAAELPYTSRHGRMPADFKHLNPSGQVPVLLVGEQVVCDSTRIVRRIVELAPHAMVTSAEAWLWEDWADRALSGYLVAARWVDSKNWPLVQEAYFGKAPWLVRAVIAPAARRRVTKALAARDFLRHGEEALWSDFRRVLDHLEERAPERGFWLGGELSVADIGLFGQLRSLRTELTLAQSREIELRPRLVDYIDRVDSATSRPRESVVSLRRAS